VESTYKSMVNRGRTQEAFALRDTAEKLARAGARGGVSQFAQVNLLNDLRNKMRAAGAVTESKAEAQKIAQSESILVNLANLDRAAFSQAMSGFEASFRERQFAAQQRAQTAGRGTRTLKSAKQLLAEKGIGGRPPQRPFIPLPKAPSYSLDTRQGLSASSAAGPGAPVRPFIDFGGPMGSMSGTQFPRPMGGGGGGTTPGLVSSGPASIFDPGQAWDRTQNTGSMAPWSFASPGGTYGTFQGGKLTAKGGATKPFVKKPTFMPLFDLPKAFLK